MVWFSRYTVHVSTGLLKLESCNGSDVYNTTPAAVAALLLHSEDDILPRNAPPSIYKHTQTRLDTVLPIRVVF